MIARILLAVAPRSFQQQLRRRLAGVDTIVEQLSARHSLWTRLRREVFDLVVVRDSRLPGPATELAELIGGLPEAPAIVVISARADHEERAQLLAAGCKAVLDDQVSSDGVAGVVSTMLAQRRVMEQQRLASGRRLAQPRLSDFVSRSPVMRSFLGLVERVVDSNVSLLIQGETGVGKERLARAIHNEGPRGTGPFTAVNCGALPETLLESELFGHEEGAFTGATRSHRGVFELAHTGTVFLDEIAELPPHLQVKLLRVLQEREFRRLGGERNISVAVRVIAATNRNLEEEVRTDAFRRDLFFRLSVVTLTIPPLSERRDDIPDLVYDYIEHLGPRMGREVRGIDDDAMGALLDYVWPGNVRELINVIERAMLLTTEGRIRLVDLPSSISQCAPTENAAVATALSPAVASAELPEELLARPWSEVRRLAVERLERSYFSALLRRTGGRVGRTAELAGIQPRSLFEKMRHHGLSKEMFRHPTRSPE